jgi:hypothetical protein
MKITARGWKRDMGENVIGNKDLDRCSASQDPNRRIHFDRDPVIFKGFTEVSIDWGKSLSLNGKYRLETHLSREDVLHLFKTMYGTELDVDLLEQEGFTVSPELQKKMLGTIKLADLTIGDLAALGSPTQEAPQAEATKPVSKFPIRKR